jgi:hypothetical protein
MNLTVYVFLYISSLRGKELFLKIHFYLIGYYHNFWYETKILIGKVQEL